MYLDPERLQMLHSVWSEYMRSYPASDPDDRMEPAVLDRGKYKIEKYLLVIIQRIICKTWLT